MNSGASLAPFLLTCPFSQIGHAERNAFVGAAGGLAADWPASRGPVGEKLARHFGQTTEALPAIGMEKFDAHSGQRILAMELPFASSGSQEEGAAGYGLRDQSPSGVPTSTCFPSKLGRDYII